ncbi:hypothetical protein GSUB_05305 [Geoalkalibacter subterraneus]|uniref:Membrane iron-sulfur containing protein FtrD-like domain-containing protein n=1 Tax=Geoalkalibacter subterraneus TaxID=483547 RepID=A0A0B5FWE4_9BACT|nr:hypothetical protein GSUB_05305 [Geoalkalibacter subterraneus]
MVYVVVTLMVAVAATVGGLSYFGKQRPGYPEVQAQNGRIEIPVIEVNDGKAHFFSYRAATGPVDFFVLRSHDGVIRAAFDACDVCYREKRGYFQEGDVMVCRNCGQKFSSDRINEVKGGCNPAPIDRQVSNGTLIIAAADLAAGARYFPADSK